MILLSHSHYSTRRSVIKPKDLVKKAKKEGYSGVAITDYGNMSSCVELYEECEKQEMMPVMGMKFFVEREDGSNYDTIIVLAKNEEGWKTLLKLNEYAYLNHWNPSREIAYINIHDLYEFYNPNLYIISGYEGSTVHAAVNYVRQEDRKAVLFSLYKTYKDFFGENFILVSEGYEYEIPHMNIRIPYYLDENDRDLFNIMLSINSKVSIRMTEKKQEFKHYFEKEYSLLPNAGLNLEVEKYNILSLPKLPRFECPTNEDEFLLEECRKGWVKVKDNLYADKFVYADRIKEELSIFKEYNLSGYFLIMSDWIRMLKRKGVLIGAARGSSSGSLVAYLTDITEVDPVRYDLPFERFMNKGRMSKEKASLPDIDTDIPPEYREETIQYIKDKYGHDKVAQIATFGTMQGRGAIKAVLKAFAVCTPAEMDNITKWIPPKDKISDELAEMEERGEDASILKWAITNVPELHDYVKYDDEHLVGEYAKYFDFAIRLEGIYQNVGMHAAGVVICSEPLNQVCPIRLSKDGEVIVALEKNRAERVGLAKLDILGLDLLSKLMYINELLEGKHD